MRNLRQAGKDWTTVTLRWDPPAGAPTPDSYTITRLPAGGGPATYTVARTMPYTVPVLQPGS